MKQYLVVLARDKPRAARRAQNKVENAGGHIRQRYGPAVLIVEAAPEVIESLAASHGVAGVYAGEVPEAHKHELDETGQIGIAAWNQRQSESFQQAKGERKGEGLAWDHPGYDPEGKPDQ